MNSELEVKERIDDFLSLREALNKQLKVSTVWSTFSRFYDAKIKYDTPRLDFAPFRTLSLLCESVRKGNAIYIILSIK